MSKNYAYHTGAFKALVEMMSARIRELDSDDEFTREWAAKTLKDLADQADSTMVELGYKD